MGGYLVKETATKTLSKNSAKSNRLKSNQRSMHEALHKEGCAL